MMKTVRAPAAFVHARDSQSADRGSHASWRVGMWGWTLDKTGHGNYTNCPYRHNNTN